MCGRVYIVYLLGEFNRVRGESVSEMRVQLSRRSNLHHLLMPSLNGTVSLIQMNHISILITWERKRKGGTGKGWRKQNGTTNKSKKNPT